MREIKFRAWDFTQNKMREVTDLMFTVINSPVVSYDDGDSYTDDIELMQYTGLKDCAEQEIYEGDILSWDSFNVLDKWVVKAVDGGWNPFISDMQVDGAWHYKVIGNIYENPELINKGGSNG